MRRLQTMAVVAVATLGTASAAYAQGPSQEGYGGVAGQVQAGATGGGLPFTGFDLGLLVVAGAILLVLGLVLRRGRTA